MNRYKERCQDCAALIAGTYDEWCCDYHSSRYDYMEPCSIYDREECPEGLELRPKQVKEVEIWMDMLDEDWKEYVRVELGMLNLNEFVNKPIVIITREED